MSFGESAVGISFNPSGSSEVNEFKQVAANFINLCNDAREDATSPEVKRMYSLAITDMQVAQMWAVKAATWRG
jgi:hypothetical protein